MATTEPTDRTVEPEDSAAYQILTFPPVLPDATPKSPERNVQRVLQVIKASQSTIENELFVIETRGGSTLQSTLYTYAGFQLSVYFYSTVGVNNDYFYLGEDQANYMGLEYGMANLALFLAKLMTDTIAYERCDPELLACGMWALDTTVFNEGKNRLQCAQGSHDDGKECLNGSVGCACTLGMLNHHIGIESQTAVDGASSSGVYDSVDFCSLDPYQSVCSRSRDNGEEMRFITAMAYWVSFVQRYSDNNGSYIQQLQSFVNGGMIDMAFVDRVASISVLGPDSSVEVNKPPTQTFQANYFKVNLATILWFHVRHSIFSLWCSLNPLTMNNLGYDGTIRRRVFDIN